MPQKPNGFFFYMRSMKKGSWSKKGLPELSALCSEGWNSMTKEEKAYYDDMKHDYDGFVVPKNKKKKKAGQVNGLDCQGRPLLFLANEDIEKRNQEISETQDILNVVKKTGCEPISGEFYLIHVTNYVITKHEPIVYCPAEISIGRFSGERGFINLDLNLFTEISTPLGYALAVKDNCEKSLKIPTTDFEKAQPMTAIADQLLKFQEKKDAVLFCHPDFRDDIVKNLETIFDAIDEDNPFKVYSLSELVHRLMVQENYSNSLSPDTITSLLHPERRTLENGLCCDYHETQDNPTCSASMLKKWVLAAQKVLEPVYRFQSNKPKVEKKVEMEAEDDDFWDEGEDQKKSKKREPVDALTNRVGRFHL